MLEKTLSETRKNLSKIVSDCTNHDGIAITVHGRPVAYLVSVEQYEKLKELTLEKELAPIFSEFDGLFKTLADK